MDETLSKPQSRSRSRIRIGYPAILGLFAVAAVAAVIWIPDHAAAAARFVIGGLFEVSPLVVPGILLAAWTNASSAGGDIGRMLSARPMKAILLASLVGALTPVCGVTVLPLMAGLLAAGVPLAPIMAFWLSSPVTDPAMLATTAATLGLDFAIGKTVAAFALGVIGGLACVPFARRSWSLSPLRRNALVGSLGQQCGALPKVFEPAVWRNPMRRAAFRAEAVSTTRLILICLIPAFAAEYALNETLQPDALTAYVGADVWWAVPVSVLVGAPAYLDGYAALPLTRGLIDHGMSIGAAMAFLVAGGVVSIWGAMVIFPVLRLKPFLIYMVVAIAGSMVAGWLFEALV